MHVKCIREFPASPLCCRSGADILSAPLTGSPQRACDAQPRAIPGPNSKPLTAESFVGACSETPLQQAEPRRTRRGVSRDGVRARADVFLIRRRVRLARVLTEGEAEFSRMHLTCIRAADRGRH